MRHFRFLPRHRRLPGRGDARRVACKGLGTSPVHAEEGEMPEAPTAKPPAARPRAPLSAGLAGNLPARDTGLPAIAKIRNRAYNFHKLLKFQNV